jgi:hypothetical protein
VIPIGTQNVELFYDVLNEIDHYEPQPSARSSLLFADEVSPVPRKNDSSNYFVKQLQA